MNTANSKIIDLVCGMTVSPESKIKSDFEGREYFFCSAHCKEKFDKDPSFYIERQREQQVEVTPIQVYFPLILISAYLMGFVLLLEIQNRSFDGMRMMVHFMSGFFFVFSFFKFLDLKGFASAYQTYDLVARKYPIYGFAYPFIELGLGIGYLLCGNCWVVNLLTLLVMAVSSFGVLQSIAKNKNITCACLGTVFQFPMSKVTLFEDLLMLLMALVGLLL